jgi:hypothetical protein
MIKRKKTIEAAEKKPVLKKISPKNEKTIRKKNKKWNEPEKTTQAKNSKNKKNQNQKKNP